MTDCMKLQITHLTFGFLKPSVNLHFMQLTGVLPSQAPSLTCLASNRIIHEVVSYSLSWKKKKISKTPPKYWCSVQCKLCCIDSAWYIVQDTTEAGEESSLISLLIQYDSFHNAVKYKCEQKKARVTDKTHQMLFSVRNPVPSPTLLTATWSPIFFHPAFQITLWTAKFQDHKSCMPMRKTRIWPGLY